MSNTLKLIMLRTVAVSAVVASAAGTARARVLALRGPCNAFAAESRCCSRPLSGEPPRARTSLFSDMFVCNKCPVESVKARTVREDGSHLYANKDVDALTVVCWCCSLCPGPWRSFRALPRHRCVSLLPLCRGSLMGFIGVPAQQLESTMHYCQPLASP